MLKLILAISLGGFLLFSVGRMFFISRVREELSSLRYSLARLKTQVRGSELHAEIIEKAESVLESAKRLLLNGQNLAAWRFLKAERTLDLVVAALLTTGEKP